MRYENRQELADRVVWEGGLDEFILNYGLAFNDLPEGDKELELAWCDLDEAKLNFEVALMKFEKLLPESDEY